MMKYFPLLLFLFLVEFAAAQMPAGLNSSSIGSSRGGGSAPKSKEIARDTSDVYYFFASNLFFLITLKPRG